MPILSGMEEQEGLSEPFIACVIAFPVMILGAAILDYARTLDGAFQWLANGFGLTQVALGFLILWHGIKEEPHQKDEDALEEDFWQSSEPLDVQI